MNPFEFFHVPRIVFGRGAFNRVGELVASQGRAAMIVSNAGEPGDGGLLDRLVEQLSGRGVRWAYWRQSGEPRVGDVEEALRIAVEGRCDCVVGLGGGSAIDAAKAVAALLTNGGAPTDYMEVVGKGEKISRPSAPWTAIPTTAGTGAEATRNAVIGWPEKQFKASLRSPHLLAQLALLDSELSVGVPDEVVACSGMDALCQLIESYTSTGSNALTEPLALQGIRLATRSLLRSHRDPRDLDARDEMALAALISGVTLTNAGLGAVHGFAAPLGALLPIPHGTICAALLPHVIAANVEALASSDAGDAVLMKYAAIGRIAAGQEDLPGTVAVDHAIRFVSELAGELQIPRLARFGLTDSLVPQVVPLAMRASSMRFNPVVLPDAVLAAILERAM